MSNTIGWGRGVSNNSIGWGNVGTNGFGSIYTRSNSGETILKDPNFIIELDTTLGDGLNQMRMPIQGTQPMDIDWGDGSVETVTQTALPSSSNWVTHSYASSGVYEIKVSETLERVYFNNEGDRSKAIKILNWGDCVWSSFEKAFNSCNNNKSLPNQAPNIQNVTSFSLAFYRNNLQELPNSLLEKAFNVTNFSFFVADNGFSNSSYNGLSFIPTGFFDNCVNASTFFAAFQINNFTELPVGVFNKMTNVNNYNLAFRTNTLSVQSLSRLYIELSVYNTKDNVPFHGGSGQYDPNFSTVIDGITYTTGVERSNLVARGWTLTDGGLAEEFYFNIEVNTSIAGVSNSDQFQFTGAVGEYDVEAYQNNNLVASFNDLVNEQTITLPSAGVYELRVIPKPAGFDKLRFSNGGDKNKLLQILQWGLYGVNEPDQSEAFRGCTNNTEIADGGAWFDVVTNGVRMFQSNSLTSLPSDMELPNLTNGLAMFLGNSLTSLPSGMELPNLTIGRQMFFNNSLTSLPAGMELPNLSDGDSMFRSNSLTSLPAGMELPNLSDGTSMFLSNALTSLSSGMELPNLSDGGNMFRNNALTSLPSGMELPNLSDGSSMFNFNNLTSLPSGMELPNLTNGGGMFRFNTLNTERYSQLLIDLEEFNPNNNVAFHGGNSQYNVQGQIARNLLISRGWTFTDGGLEI